jgi:UDP-N-acetylmuramyl pentapeptide synthase
VDLLLAVGRLGPALAEGFAGPAKLAHDATAAAALLPDIVAPGDVVLVKASRGVGLELVCRALQAGPGLQAVT